MSAVENEQIAAAERERAVLDQRPDPPLTGSSAAGRDAAALDAYSRTVIEVAERLGPSVANLRITRPTRGGRVPAGAGSAIVLTPTASCSPPPMSWRARTGRAPRPSPTAASTRSPSGGPTGSPTSPSCARTRTI